MARAGPRTNSPATGRSFHPRPSQAFGDVVNPVARSISPTAFGLRMTPSPGATASACRRTRPSASTMSCSSLTNTIRPASIFRRRRVAGSWDGALPPPSCRGRMQVIASRKKWQNGNRPLAASARARASRRIVFILGLTGDGLRTWADLPAKSPASRTRPLGLLDTDYETRWLRTSPESGPRTPICRSALHLRPMAPRRAGPLSVACTDRAQHWRNRGPKGADDDDALAKDTSAVILFGTPSGGLVKARSIFFWKRQLAHGEERAVRYEIAYEVARRSASTRRSPSWRSGERDQLVPPESSIKPFPDDQRRSSPATTPACWRRAITTPRRWR